MKGGPKSSLKPFLHRALQLFFYSSSIYLKITISKKLKENIWVQIIMPIKCHKVGMKRGGGGEGTKSVNLCKYALCFLIILHSQ